MQSLIFTIATRNVARHWRRSLIAGCTIGIGLAALLFLDALFTGMRLSMIEMATGSLVGHAEVVRKGYAQKHEADQTVNGASSVIKQLASDPRVASFAPRLTGSGVLSSAGGSTNVSLMGVDAAREAGFSNMARWVTSGHFCQNAGEAVVGATLAERLQLKVGDRIVVGAGRAATGELAQEAYRVAGIMRSGMDSLDERATLLRLTDAQKLLDLPDQVHEIAVKFKSEDMMWDRGNAWWAQYSQGGNQALSWQEVLPQLEGAFAFLRYATFLIVLALVFAATLSIVNVLFMSLYERMSEFGVLRAIGTTPTQLGSLIVWESFGLALISVLVGMLLGATAIAIAQKVGIPYQGVEFAGVNLQDKLRPTVAVYAYFLYGGIIVLCCVLAALIPARTAMRILPIKAIQNHGN